VDTEALRWFQQVAEGVSVTEVGDIYGVTQSGVSRGLARLEQQVGTPLLQRSGRALRMTYAGAAMKPHVDAMLNDLDDGLAAVHEVVDPDVGTVALAFQPSLGTWLVPFLVGGFRAKHPGVRFVLRQARDDVVVAVLSGGRVDLEITTLRPSTDRIAWRRLLLEPLCLAVASGHRLAPLSEVNLAQSANEPFVALRPQSMLRRLGVELCQRAGFEPGIPFEGDDLPTVLAFVSAGLGVAIVPAARETTLAGRSPVRHLPIADPAAVREIGLAWSLERRMLPAAERFRRHIIATATASGVPAVAAAGPAGHDGELDRDAR
jgi:DNA-binding transcriptional LysR family regulator